MDKLQERPSIKLNDPVFVQIEYATTFGWSDLTMSLQNCYATDTPEFNEHMRYHPLISGKCRSPEDDSVQIIENGQSAASKFKFNMFKWRGVIAYIYLHCEVHICNTTMEMCYGEGPQCHGGNRQKRSVRGAQHYSIQADLSDLGNEADGQSEGYVNYDLLEKKDESFDPVADYMPEAFDEMPEDSQLTDFITRGPILIDDDEMNNIGQGSIETTMHAISYDDDFLRIYIFSTIAVLICLVAVTMACLLALKRRKNLEKVNSINPVMSSTQSSDVPNLGFSTAGLTPDDLRLGAYKSTSKALPAITGLPLPPTPKELENSSDENRSVTSSENSKRNLMLEQKSKSYNPARHNSFAGTRAMQSGRPRLTKVESQRITSAYRK